MHRTRRSTTKQQSQASDCWGGSHWTVSGKLRVTDGAMVGACTLSAGRRLQHKSAADWPFLVLSRGVLYVSRVAACQSGELLSSAGLRSDGRRWSELRSVAVQCGVASTASGVDGSCSYQQGNTLVLATVSGPRELPGGFAESASADGGCRVSVHVKQAAFVRAV